MIVRQFVLTVDNMPRLTGPLLLLGSFLLLGQGYGLLLQRPEQDCINPSVSKVNEFNFFPSEYRSIISTPPPVAPGATVSAHNASCSLIKTSYCLECSIGVVIEAHGRCMGGPPSVMRSRPNAAIDAAGD